MIPTSLLGWALVALCVIGTRHFRRKGNKIGFWVMLIVTLALAGFTAFLTVFTVVLLLSPGQMGY